MAERRWFPGIEIDMDSNAILNFSLNVAPWFGTSTVTAATVSGVNCDASLLELAGSLVKFQVSSVTNGAEAAIRCVTNDGQSDDFTFKFNPINQ